jgi:type II secretory pathway component HofQ
MPAEPTNPLAAPDNVAITVEKIATDVRTSTEASAGFQYEGQNVTLSGGDMARRNGIRIGVAAGNLKAQVGASARRSRSSSRESTFIVCQSGTEGQILVGEDTFVQRLGYWGPFGYQVLVERAFVGRSLVVRPRILQGRLIEVELFPRFTVRGQRGAIDVTQLATKVVVRDGQSIAIGGTTTAQDDIGAVLFGIGRETRQGAMTMVLTPKIGGMEIDWPKGKW